MKKVLQNWPKLAFIFVPLFILTFDAAVLISERLEPDTQKAIRRVRESKSRKENFTVQQYLYTTVYHRQGEGEAITIDGWRAEPSPDAPDKIIVEFAYSDATGRHTALWEVPMKGKKVIPRNEIAGELSWH
ncbi:MAG TPA: hypothetical protein VNO70_12000 [Blastocatellia bacterium]|nr:hypothetical protein [Blastocatellia bacterium]